ncbi:MAG: hypothetical protein COX77_01410 [Candidatus Komeilibacteria bacterium CG_4_10_14_0_2_um_filter_37_10]|uniref:Helix-turn-helix domain-containing protein n=1 Tax=Candidatus Komeilibacteria bacterium CG_4_10_14_0_2_um_filter_37_10 TaxID=1974470 RepID=A0A2M7VFS3_9BACT|nr:MAG: hypothetical protein COX77_01410 [Candidatus Komeilibacteria bacterium CG_4_10_14_0_2_um_filter_37_10]
MKISISEASKLFGLSTKTIRLAIKNKELPYLLVRDRYRLEFTDVLLWTRKSVRKNNIFQRQGLGQYATDWQIPIKEQSKPVDKKIIQKDDSGNFYIDKKRPTQ